MKFHPPKEVEAMKLATPLAAGLHALFALAVPAVLEAQTPFALPERCGVATEVQESAAGASSGQSADTATGDHAMHGADGAMPDHVRQNMEKMVVTMHAMHEGMMQEDPDIAFACGMIAHHQAAIDMAGVLLEHGRDAQMRTLAANIIATQAGEIDQMTRWLETVPD
ncbi:DUF305 domain-containing protein [Sulfitobacter sp. LCG007]